MYLTIHISPEMTALKIKIKALLEDTTPPTPERELPTVDPSPSCELPSYVPSYVCGPLLLECGENPMANGGKQNSKKEIPASR